ncbi:hypothetical protein [Litorivivens sp.]|uniref:hypothetical protein n=1 Tax=Litorivivens sp. TaxID=2020868 RepID=UPI0035634686
MYKSLCLALLILAGTTSAFADCSVAVFYESPSVPDAREADYTEMQQAVATIQNYIFSAEKMLEECNQLDTFSFNYYVGRLKSLAASINRQASLFNTLLTNS